MPPSHQHAANEKLNKEEEKEEEEEEEYSFWQKCLANSQLAREAPKQAPISFKTVAITAAISFLGMGSLSLIHYGASNASDLTMILGSMGATSVLVFGAPQVPFSQPRNVIGGHIIAGLVGVACWRYLAIPMDGAIWLALPVALTISLALMQLTKTVHPPAGGTVLIAIQGSEAMHLLGYKLLIPTTFSAIVLVCVGLLNNLAKDRQYPTRWM